VSADAVQSYAPLWRQLRDSAEQLGARAWVFSAIDNDYYFTEFIEWQSAADDLVIDRSPLAAARLQLNATFPYEDSETWKEARL
jgi:hypothetical protein